MKKVNLFGCTTAEKLIKLQEAYESLVDGLLGNATPRGDYEASTAYQLGDMVMDNGSSYLFINENNSVGIPLTNKNYWFQIAARGSDGSDGKSISTIENDGYSDGNGFTISHIKTTLTSGETEYFDVQARDGQSVTDVTAGTPVVETDYTTTPITFYFNANDSETVNVKAKNGVNGVNATSKLYIHKIKVTFPSMQEKTNPFDMVFYANTSQSFSFSQLKRALLGTITPIYFTTSSGVYTAISVIPTINKLQVFYTPYNTNIPVSLTFDWVESGSLLDDVYEV